MAEATASAASKEETYTGYDSSGEDDTNSTRKGTDYTSLFFQWFQPLCNLVSFVSLSMVELNFAGTLPSFYKLKLFIFVNCLQSFSLLDAWTSQQAMQESKIGKSSGIGARTTRAINSAIIWLSSFLFKA